MYGPCCNSQRKLAKIDTFDFQNDEYLTRLRQQFSANVRPDECRRCWIKEDSGQSSRRTDMIEFFKANEIQFNESEIVSLDYNSSWACNLACVMCGPFFSSTWATELGLDAIEREKIGRLTYKKNRTLDYLDLSSVKKVHFNGGEPLINDEHIEVLDQFNKHGNLSQLTVTYNTNGTCRPSKKMIDLWKQCKFVRIFFSVDAIDNAFEYIRWPGRWNETSKNILEMKQNLPSNVAFGFHVAVGLNLLDLKPMIDWFDKNISTNREGDSSNFVWVPMMLKGINLIEVLSDRCKQEALEELQALPTAKNIVSSIRHSARKHDDGKWIEWLDDLDKKRGLQWRDSLAIGKYYR
jgi:MoaA/NifB/PqqE/SkfB family radical SAM enzyme